MTKTYVDILDSQTRLAELGVEEEPLIEVVRRGYVAFASCTPNDPPLAPGFLSWSTMVRALREYLLPEWERSDENNYSLVINPSGTVAIAVATGDDGTGRVDGTPTTKSSKGPSTADAVTSNQLQLELFPPVEVPARSVVAENHRIAWILLVHRAKGEVRCELSLPSSMGTDGRVDRWEERIILKSVPTDPAALDDVVPPHLPVLPDISVDVKRRV
jgi:hypothetical protein